VGFIDKKGKLFGLINIIDFSVILLVIACILVGHMGYTRITRKRKQDTKKTFNIKVILQSVPIDVAKVVKVGDKERGYAEIIDIKRVDTKRFVFPYEIAKNFEDSEELLQYEIVPKMIITFRCLGFVKQGEMYLNNKVRKIGKKFTFSTLKYDIEGQIINLWED